MAGAAKCFGEPRGPLSTPPWGYTGEWHDPAGLVYLRARWYSPALGRFSQVDPFPGLPGVPATLHPYAYVLNDPLNSTDPGGEVAPWLTAAAVAAVVNYGLQVANNYYGQQMPLGEALTRVDTGEIVASAVGGAVGQGVTGALGRLAGALAGTAVRVLVAGVGNALGGQASALTAAVWKHRTEITRGGLRADALLATAQSEGFGDPLGIGTDLLLGGGVECGVQWVRGLARPRQPVLIVQRLAEGGLVPAEPHWGVKLPGQGEGISAWRRGLLRGVTEFLLPEALLQASRDWLAATLASMASAPSTP